MKKSLSSGSMVEEKEVSVGWQMFFMIIPFVNMWAFYRIRKFWLGIVGTTALFLIPTLLIFNSFAEPVAESIVYGGTMDSAVTYFESLNLVLEIEGVLQTVLMIFLVRRWSMSWNDRVTYQRRVF